MTQSPGTIEPSQMIMLTDEQLQIVRELATPLHPRQRQQFLARRLVGIELGNGMIYAAAVAAQREVLSGSHAVI
jgi:hypothetical protein